MGASMHFASVRLDTEQPESWRAADVCKFVFVDQTSVCGLFPERPKQRVACPSYQRRNQLKIKVERTEMTVTPCKCHTYGKTGVQKQKDNTDTRTVSAKCS